MKVEFSFRYEEHGRDNIVEVKECKYPSRTGTHRRLVNSLDQGFIYSFKWRQL
jgi:hypothetical protein